MTLAEMTLTSTRTQLIESACRLFAAHGYAGASISAIAQELGLSKQALLHHFGSKNALYALAVEQAASSVLQLLFDAMEDDRPPEEQLETFFAAYQSALQADCASAQIVLRELLDQALPRDGGTSFATLFESLVATVQATERWEGKGVAGALGVVTQLLGAASLMGCTHDAWGRYYEASVLSAAQVQARAPFAEMVSGVLRG